MFLPISFLAGVTLFGLIFLILTHTTFFSRKNEDTDDQIVAERIVALFKHISANMTISGGLGLILSAVSPADQWLCLIAAAFNSLVSVIIIQIRKEKDRNNTYPASISS